MDIKAMTEAALALRGLRQTKKARRFDMGVWGFQDECGTCACAAGWLLILGKLPGFSAHFDAGGDIVAVSSKGGAFTVAYAAETALALGPNEFADIFYGTFTSPQEVAGAMREMIEDELARDM